jgi:predicted Zn-dependent protease
LNTRLNIGLQRLVSIVFICCSLLQPTVVNALVSDTLQLPELGDSASSLFSLEKEHQLGTAWLRAFRSQVRTVEDPLLQDYLEDLIYRLATYSELKDRRLNVVIVENRAINAFAVPGGVIGIHNGLMLHANTEAQLASVLAHELAHLSQRHFARSVEAQQNNSLPNMAGILAGLILAATVGGDAGIAAITATQAASLQSQLRYSRLHEREADRAGMQTMVKAEMNPAASAAMFREMLKASRYSGTRPPEFLLTHPVTESRISDSLNRARQYPRKVYVDNLEYQLMRTRVELHFADNSKEAVEIFRARLKATSHYPDADRYGLVISLISNNDLEEAEQQLKPLLDNSPHQLNYIIAQADIDIAAGKLQTAIDNLNQALKVSPGNHPLVMTLADAYLKANQAHRAATILNQHTRRKPNDPLVWYTLAEAQGLAGNIVGVHRARAEYFLLNGVLDRAQKQLSYALPLLKGDHITTTKVNERIRQIQQMKRELERL